MPRSRAWATVSVAERLATAAVTAGHGSSASASIPSHAGIDARHRPHVPTTRRSTHRRRGAAASCAGRGWVRREHRDRRRRRRRPPRRGRQSWPRANPCRHLRYRGRGAPLPRRTDGCTGRPAAGRGVGGPGGRRCRHCRSQRPDRRGLGPPPSRRWPPYSSPSLSSRTTRPTGSTSSSPTPPTCSRQSSQPDGGDGARADCCDRTATLDVTDALVAESATYSLLQAGPEHAAWLCRTAAA